MTSSQPAPSRVGEERAAVTLVFKWHRQSLEQRCRLAAGLATALPAERDYLEVDEVVARFGPSPEERAATAALVRGFAEETGLSVISQSPRCAVLEGTLTAISEALGIAFRHLDVDGERVRVHDEDVTLPAALADRVDRVLGTHTLPRSDRCAASGPASAGPSGRSSEPTADGKTHTEIDDLCGVYDFPPGKERSGTDLTIGIVCLGGGLHDRDLRRYFDYHGVARPKITVVRQSSSAVQREPVDGRWGEPVPVEVIQAAVDDPPSVGRLPKPVLKSLKWTVEATMDVQLIGRVCPGAEIVLYLASNDNQGEYWALSEALYGRHQPSVISCSWGSPEPTPDRTDRIVEIEILDSLLLDAALLGRTICVASGDRGDGGTPASVYYPASSKYVLACGGTMFQSERLEPPETVWNEMVMGTPMSSGGGYSRLFDRPEWQEAHVPTTEDPSRGGSRGVPDVAAKADVAHGFCMLVGDRDIANGGTSASAPLWSGMMALCCQRLGAPTGFVNSLLYSDALANALRAVNQGTNGAYEAGPGWNPCCGLGSPMWSELCEALGGSAPSPGQQADG